MNARVKIYNSNKFPYFLLDDVERVSATGNTKSSNYGKQYLNILCSFDIETTNLPDIKQAIMYHWQVCVDGIGYVTGRTWSQFKLFITKVCKRLNENETLVMFVHNLSYEFSFLQGQFDFKPKDVFAVESRKILTAVPDTVGGNIEFRCSYLQTNMSLKMFLEEYEAEDAKLDNFDYDKFRFSDTELDDEELEYCLHDVSGLIQAMKKRMAIKNDTIATLPKTSTGYPRRDINSQLPKIRELLNSIQPDTSVYVLLNWAYRGGNTHANRWYIGGLIPNILKDIQSWDIASSYPNAILNCKFPITAFEAIQVPYGVELTERILVNHIKNNEACLMYVTFKNIRLKDKNWGCPYISLTDKFLFSDVNKDSTFDYDNGRILKANFVSMAITDIDYQIIKEEYDYDSCEIHQLFTAKYGSIPEDIKEVIREYFLQKTKLKGVIGSESEYALFKALLNAIYGLMSQNPVKAQTKFNPEGNGIDRFTVENFKYVVYEDEEEDEVTNKYAERIAIKLREHNQRLSMPYQWGVWTTAWARRELEDMLRIVHNHYDAFNCYFVYCDTDSCKFYDKYDVCKADIEAYNEKRKQSSIENKAFAVDSKGKTQYMGVFDYEGKANRFMTLGSKRYVCEYMENDKPYLSLTISGVQKIEGAIELSVMGGISAFKDGMEFGTHDLPEYVVYGGHGYLSSEFPEIKANVIAAKSEFERIKAEQGLLKAKEIFNSKEYKSKGWDKYRKGYIVEPHKSKAGGTVCYYNDTDTVLEEDYKVNGEVVLKKGTVIPPNVFITGTTKKVNRTEQLVNLNTLCAMCIEYMGKHTLTDDMIEVFKQSLTSSNKHRKDLKGWVEND